MNYRFVLVDSARGLDQTHWILRPPVTVGRSSEAEISIGDPSISRRHCQFTVNPMGALVVRDLGSTNGVYIENERVNKAVVRPGVAVQIGAITLRPEWTEDDVREGEKAGATWELDATQPMKIVELDDETGQPVENPFPPTDDPAE